MTRHSLRCVLALWFLVMGSVCAAQDWSGYVPAGDGTSLATDVHLPPGEGPWPVVLTRTPYGRISFAPWCQTLTSHGFACVVQDDRGHGASDGSDTVFRDSGRDGRTTVSWIADQAWCDGAIASVGGSAMGIAGYALAPGAAPELQCVFAAMATPDIPHHVFMHGGVIREDLFLYGLTAEGSQDFIDEALEHRLRDGWWEDYDWLNDVDSVRARAVHFGGWFDLSIQGPIDAFTAYQHSDGEAAGRQHLIVGPWHHFSLASAWMAQPGNGDRQTGELRFPDNAFPGGWPFPSEWQLLTNWLGACLRGEATPAAQWPPVTVYLMGAVGEEDAPGNHWVDLADWPPAAHLRRYYLGEGSTLEREVPPRGERILDIDPNNPVPTLGGPTRFPDLEVDGRPMGSGPMDQRPVEARGDVLTFTSDVLDAPVTVMGRVRARLWIRPDTPDLDLSVRLTDVYPDGRSMLVLDGIQRARMRCGDDTECFLEPGVPVQIEVDLWSTAMVFNAGHRIRVDVAGSNWPRFEVNPNDGGDLDDGTPIIARPALLFGRPPADEAEPSALLLPVVRTPRRPGGRHGALRTLPELPS